MAPPAPFLQFLVHINIMLVTLCALITALTCVSGVTVVTQKPVLSVRKGETATMDCNLGTVDNTVFWYKQIPGGVPQHVLRFYHSWGSPNYGSGFSAPKFTSTHQSTKDYRLIIKNVEEGDSAVYYCKTWDNNNAVSQ
uniref:Ig-like domain-containing protein n=1 Tax=Pundamilia nyererei TaxID=303518 RepID=A0A3B4F744_9CICH